MRDRARLDSTASAENMAYFSLSRDAGLKPVLHAAKHPASPVLGVLLGKDNESKGMQVSSSGDSSRVTVCDAVPLFHNIPLAPMLEMAMMQVTDARAAACTAHVLE